VAASLLAQERTKGSAGTDSRHFNLPTDVGFAPNGDLYVSDGYGSARVVKFSHDGKYLLQFGKRGTGPGEFGLPHNVVVDAQGRVQKIFPNNNWTRDELANEADTGTRGQGAVVEATWRLVEATRNAGDCASVQTAEVIKLTNTLRVLTWKHQRSSSGFVPGSIRRAMARTGRVACLCGLC
jgi:hypothetical protein